MGLPQRKAGQGRWPGQVAPVSRFPTVDHALTFDSKFMGLPWWSSDWDPELPLWRALIPGRGTKVLLATWS